MSNAEAENWTEGTDSGCRPRQQPLTDAQIEQILGDFRSWLRELPSSPQTPAAPPPPESPNLFTLLAQFTALRHEVNLQTKATRGTLEQNHKLLEQLQANSSEASQDEHLRPLLKTLIELHDALSVAHRQVEKTIEALLRGPVEPVKKAPAQSLWSRLFGRGGSANNAEVAPEASPLQVDSLAAIGDGYALSLRRIDRILPQYQLSVIESVGTEFDPETMEAVELCAEGESGVVVEEIRRGYQWKGKLFRCAQVKVGR